MTPEQIEKQHVADALWLPKFEAKKIPPEVLENLQSAVHSPEAYAKRMRDYIAWLRKHQQSYNPNYDQRYQQLHATIKGLSPQQAYALRTNFMGRNVSLGFDRIPPKADLRFPRDHMPKPHSQIGWHFFVGSVWDEQGQEYGVELMFFRAALLPPKLAREAGTSDIQNQVVEVQLGISKAGERHHQADPVVVSGTSGLVKINQQPFMYMLGKNYIKSTSKDFLPLRLCAQGVDRGGKKPFKLGLNLNLNSKRPVLKQGDAGCMPSLAGIGTLYYSIPGLTLGAGSSLNYGGKEVKLKSGLLWFDHQWGFMGGNPDSAVLRAASNMSGKSVSGWDWYMAQFDGDRQLTMFATHSPKYLKYYYQGGAKPPGVMSVQVAGKYMDKSGRTHLSRGKLTIDRWAKARATPNRELYPITNVWHPNGWHFEFDQVMPADIRSFSMKQIVPVAQTNFFANGAQYNEGAVYLLDQTGKQIGRGFAEAVSYADTFDNALALAGLGGSPSLAKTLRRQTDTPLRRLSSLLYMLKHKDELKQVLTSAAGMEYMGPAPKAKNQSHIKS